MSAERRAAAEPPLEHLTREVRRLLEQTEDEPVGVLTAYRNAMLRLADAIDRLAGEVDSRKPH